MGGSVGCFDWSCVDCSVEFSPGGVWIGYIRPGLEDGTLIDAAPVTGSLVSSSLFGCRDVFCTAGFSSIWTFCGIDWVLPVGYQVYLHWIAKRWTMAASGVSVVDDRAGITFGVELYVPWDAPEAVVDVSSAGVVRLRNVPDVNKLEEGMPRPPTVHMEQYILSSEFGIMLVCPIVKTHPA